MSASPYRAPAASVTNDKIMYITSCHSDRGTLRSLESPLGHIDRTRCSSNSIVTKVTVQDGARKQQCPCIRKSLGFRPPGSSTPLVLLTISDLIARRSLRRQDLPVLGALFGQQNGRDISLEFATECQIISKDDGTLILHDAWFKDRVQQYKDVHKAPALEIVGWFTTAPVTGPEAQHLAIHEQILHNYNETALILTFHPSSVLEGARAGGSYH